MDIISGKLVTQLQPAQRPRPLAVLLILSNGPTRAYIERDCSAENGNGHDSWSLGRLLAHCDRVTICATETM